MLETIESIVYYLYGPITIVAAIIGCIAAGMLFKPLKGPAPLILLIGSVFAFLMGIFDFVINIIENFNLDPDYSYTSWLWIACYTGYLASYLLSATGLFMLAFEVRAFISRLTLLNNQPNP